MPIEYVKQEVPGYLQLGVMPSIDEITQPANPPHDPLSAVLRQLNRVLRGWTNYFRHGVSKRGRMASSQASPGQLEVPATALPGEQVVAGT